MHKTKLVEDLNKRKLFKKDVFHKNNTEEEYYWDDYDLGFYSKIPTYNPNIQIKTNITPSKLIQIHGSASPNTKFIYNKISPKSTERFIKKLIIIYNTHLKIIPFRNSSTQTGYDQPVKQSKVITPCNTPKRTESLVCHDASTQTPNTIVCNSPIQTPNTIVCNASTQTEPKLYLHLHNINIQPFNTHLSSPLTSP